MPEYNVLTEVPSLTDARKQRMTPTYTDRAALSKKVGAFLFKKFHESKLSRKEAAERAGISEGYLTGILAGRTVLPGPFIIERMARHWGFSRLELYMLIGMVSESDLEQYAASKKLGVGLAGDLQTVYARLATVPPHRRKRIVDLVLQMLNQIEDSDE